MYAFKIMSTNARAFRSAVGISYGTDWKVTGRDRWNLGYVEYGITLTRRSARTPI